MANRDFKVRHGLEVYGNSSLGGDVIISGVSTFQNNVHLLDNDKLLIGAGGAARGVIKPLLDCQPEQLVICNRTHSKAEALADKFNQFGTVVAVAADDLDAAGYDVVINSSSSSLTFELPPVPATIFNKNTFAYDMSYKNVDTTFVAWAKEQGAAKSVDGLGMLVGQAAESFFVWHGKRPDINPVLAELRASL